MVQVLEVGKSSLQTVEIDGEEFVVKVTRNGAYSYGNAWKTRVFVGGQPDPKMPRPEYTVIGESPENDRLWKQYNREEIKIHKAVASAVSKADERVTDLKFSRKAGCSCPCSPGFRGAGDFGQYSAQVLGRLAPVQA
jgi:hypothetical protein